MLWQTASPPTTTSTLTVLGPDGFAAGNKTHGRSLWHVISVFFFASREFSPFSLSKYSRKYTKKGFYRKRNIASNSFLFFDPHDSRYNNGRRWKVVETLFSFLLESQPARTSVVAVDASYSAAFFVAGASGANAALSQPTHNPKAARPLLTNKLTVPWLISSFRSIVVLPFHSRTKQNKYFSYRTKKRFLDEPWSY